MATVQKQFNEFNGNIRLGVFDENATLREKRDIIRNKLKDRLPDVFESAGEDCPKFYFRNQGSYEMGTGVIPLHSDYDIDQGLYFEVSTEDYPDPVTLKKRVHAALNGHTDNVCIRRSCVTAFYHQDDEPIYHVDIAVYSDSTANFAGKCYIAKGKENSQQEYRIWEPSNPQALTDKIQDHFTDSNNRDQFRRIVRYLKRWKDENFSSGNGAPIGIGLTIATYNWLENCYIDVTSGDPDDLTALRKMIPRFLGAFTLVWDAKESMWVDRLVVKLPVEPFNDLFVKMTANQMAYFKAKLKTLQMSLDTASEEVDPVEACEELRKVFGDDFPVPPKDETAKRHRPAIVSSSNSA